VLVVSAADSGHRGRSEAGPVDTTREADATPGGAFAHIDQAVAAITEVGKSRGMISLALGAQGAMGSVA
jgi:hypothetical protein